MRSNSKMNETIDNDAEADTPSNIESVPQTTQRRGNTNSRLRSACFTLNNYKIEEYDSIIRTFNELKFDYIIGKEVGESGTPHLQGYVVFNRQIRWSRIKKWNNRWHIEKPKGTKKQNIAYCSKDGDYISTWKESIKDRIMNMYKKIVWRGWQQQVIDLVETDPDNRTIHWYYEFTGNVGKSFLCKYLVLKYDGIIASGKKSDVFNQVKCWLDEHKNESPRLIILDIPRTARDYVNYGVLEKLKDGMIYSGKYEGGICCLENVHVICFANSPPDMDRMSNDRWNINYIEEEKQ